MPHDSFFDLICAVLIESNKQEEAELLEEEQAAEDEECQRGHTLEELKTKTGLEEDELRLGMKSNENLLAHSVINENGARYDLLKHREGQSGWQPGVDF